MPLSRITQVLSQELEDLRSEGRAKGKEFIVVDVKKPQNGKGPRFFLKGFGDKEFIRMNSNSYLGMQFN
ncbi:MAG: pyridoxal phosphate-dependent aminotransferase family protein, partial [Caldanaerobacter subterraneus]|nr:pyridoxal phosphate-dependent aminotransferase family protein [Caldanaerobacter subterraneus]